MKKTMKYFMFLLVSTMVVFTSCKDDDEPNGGGGTAGNSAISELAVTPNADVKYGDEVTLTAKFADEKGLRQYMISVSNANGAFYETTKMLTGKTYDMNEKIALPLPKNAVAGDLTISVTVKNSSNELSTEEVGIKGVTLPTFDALYLALDTIWSIRWKRTEMYFPWKILFRPVLRARFMPIAIKPVCRGVWKETRL